MKTYPLDTQALVEYEGNTLGYFSKGHHDAIAFAIDVHLAHDEIVTRADVRHEWWRCMPTGEKGQYVYQEVRGPGRGHFPVTVWYL